MRNSLTPVPPNPPACAVLLAVKSATKHRFVIHQTLSNYVLYRRNALTRPNALDHYPLPSIHPHRPSHPSPITAASPHHS